MVKASKFRKLTPLFFLSVFLKVKKMIHFGDLLGFIIKLFSLTQQLSIVVAFEGISGDIVKGFIFYFIGVGTRWRIMIKMVSQFNGRFVCFCFS